MMSTAIPAMSSNKRSTLALSALLLLWNTASAFLVTPQWRIITFRPTQRAPSAITDATYCSSLREQRSVRLFGGDGGADKKTKELARFEQVGPAEKYNTLVEYVRLWSDRYNTGAAKLTTPVKDVVIHDDLPEDGVDSCVYVRILFAKADTGYKSKKEEDDEEEEDGDTKKKEEDAKQGGVEILVEKLPGKTLRVRARRCEMDDETVVKEMSEEAIVKELKEALDVWKKEQQ